MYSIYIGHHKPSVYYNVLLPCSAFSESHGLYMNILGIVQRTVKAVQPPITDTEMLHTTDVVLCSLIRYVFNTVKLPSSTSNSIAILERSALIVQMFKQYFPYSTNYLDDLLLCVQLLQSNAVCFNSILYVSTVRSNYSTDIITRNNASFMPDTAVNGNDMRRILINYN